MMEVVSLDFMVMTDVVSEGDGLVLVSLALTVDFEREHLGVAELEFVFRNGMADFLSLEAL